jgi:hypothetical protein
MMVSTLCQTSDASSLIKSVEVVSGANIEVASPIIDGIVDQVYGAPKASDPSGDGNGNANMDLLDLYIADDADYFYFAFTVNADLSSVNWGKYALYIDTTNDANGATSDAWGRNVIVNDPHKPEFSVYSWLDATPYGTEGTQFWAWNQGNTSWSEPNTIDAVAICAG